MDHTEDWFAINPERSLFLSKNLRSVKKRHPYINNQLEESKTKLETYQFKRVSEGQYACRQNRNGQWLDVYSPSWFETELEMQYRRIKEMLQRGTELLFIAGSGLGYLLGDIQQCLEEDKTTSVVMIETRPELMLAQLCLFDCLKALEFDDFHWVLSENFQPDLEELLHDEALLTVNRSKIVSLPERSLTQDERAQYMPLSQRFVEWQNQYFSKQQQLRIQYDQRVNQPADLKEGTIWTASLIDAYAHTPLLRSLASGFTANGMKDVFFPLKRSRTSNERITQSLLECCPDAYLFLHLASKRVIPEEIHRPRFIWYLDHPKHFEWEIDKEEFYENDFIFYSDRRYAGYFADTNVGGAFHLTVCPSLKKKGNYRKELAAPVMFVGNHTPVETMTKNLKGKIRDELFSMADELMFHPTLNVVEAAKKIKLSDAAMHIFQSMAEVFTSTIHRDFGSDKKKLDYFFYAFTNSYKRERYIKALLDTGLIIYGPDSWLGFLGEAHADRFRGWLDYDDLADAYASAQVCINIHSLQCPTCLNSRDFDVLRAGGCLVADKVEDIHAGYLQPDHDLKVCRNSEELATVVQELLEDDSKREELREQGHQTVLSRHLPQHRAQEIMQAFQSTGWG